jgi:hypothetical protein
LYWILIVEVKLERLLRLDVRLKRVLGRYPTPGPAVLRFWKGFIQTKPPIPSVVTMKFVDMGRFVSGLRANKLRRINISVS